MLFAVEFPLITFTTSAQTLTKRDAAILKFSAPALITSREVIIARYDTILHQSERARISIITLMQDAGHPNSLVQDAGQI